MQVRRDESVGPSAEGIAHAIRYPKTRIDAAQDAVVAFEYT
jgi:hypothetical protein